MGFRPGGGEAAQSYEKRTGIKAPRIIAWEITRSCNLSCAHCRASAEFGYYPGELSLEQIKATIDDIVTISNPIIILTGQHEREADLQALQAGADDFLVKDRLDAVTIDLPVLAASAIVAFVVALVCGAAPAIQAARSNFAGALRAAVTSSRPARRLRDRFRGALRQ